MQTPAPFEYERATSVEGALASLQKLGPDARVIAGGHSLLPMMKLRLANPGHLIDINQLTELAYIREEGDEIAIGALTRHVELQRSELLARHLPLFRDAENVIADPVVRNWGTIGGSLCQADAAEDLSAVCAAAKAKAVIRGADGERVVAMEDFHLGPYQTAVGDGELLTEVRLPLRPGAGSAHEKVERRAGDWAIAAASAAVWIEGGAITDAGIALAACGLTTVHVARAEEALRGQAPSEELWAQAGEIAAADCSPGRGRPRPGRLQASSRRSPHEPRAPARGRTRPRKRGLRCTCRSRSTACRSPARSSRACCSSTSSATRPASPAPTGAATPRTAAPAWCCSTAGRSSRAPPWPRCARGTRSDGRVARSRRPARPGAAGVPRAARAPVRLLHAGMLMTARALLDENPDPSEQEIRTAISGAICRCTGYKNIVGAVRWAAEYEATASRRPRAGPPSRTFPVPGPSVRSASAG